MKSSLISHKHIFSSKTMEVRRKGHIFSSVRRKELSTKLLRPVKIFFKNEETIKTLSDEGNWESLSLANLFLKKENGLDRSLNRKEIIRGRYLGTSGRKNEQGMQKCE